MVLAVVGGRIQPGFTAGQKT
jgi:hypothetical protein